MKTLKILTVAVVGAIAIAVVSGMLDTHERPNLFAERPTPNKEQKDTSIKEETAFLKGYKIGDAATDFNLKNIDGRKVSLKSFDEAKGYVVIFTCNHCPYSVAYENRIIAIDKKYKNLGYPVIAINPNNPEKNPIDSFENMQVRAKEKGFTFPYLIDSEQKIYPQYGATKTPHVFLLKKEGDQNIVKYMGAIDDNYQDVKAVKNKYLENALQSLIRGEKIAVTSSIAIGCRIE